MKQEDIIILDEPMNALDKDGVNIIKNIMLEEKTWGISNFSLS